MVAYTMMFCLFLPGRSQAIRAESTRTYAFTLGEGSTAVPEDSAILYSPIERKRGKAISINVGLNMVMRGFNRFVKEDEFAKINLSSMRNNLTTLPVWDTNRFPTNFIGHPYHGAMYFNSARTNGFDFYSSTLVTSVSSLMWEYLMETKPPSHNDLWATSVGGSGLGEALFRFSDFVLDNRATGIERVGRELIAGILAPTRLITRVTTGEAWKTGKIKGNLLNAAPYRLDFYAGEKIIIDTRFEAWRHALGIELHYGDLFGALVEQPYEWFQLEGEASIGNGSFHLTRVNNLGLIFNKELYRNNNSWVSGGLFQHFNYYDFGPVAGNNKAVPFYFSEAASFGPGIILLDRRSNREAQFGVHVSGIILGATVSDYFKLDDREYNFGSGMSLKAQGSVTLAKKLHLSLFAENWLLYSWKSVDDYDLLEGLTMVEIDFLNVQGDKSRTRWHVSGLSMRYRLNERMHVMLTARHVSRSTAYTHFSNVKHSLNELLFGIGVNV